MCNTTVLWQSFFSLMISVCLVWSAAAQRTVTFELLEDSTDYAELLNVGDILTIEDDIVVYLDSISGIPNSSFIATSTPRCGAPRFTSGLHMYNFGTLRFDPSNINDTTNVFEFSYNYPCGEPFSIEFEGVGLVRLTDRDCDVILDDNIFISCFGGLVQCSGDFEAVKIGGRKLALDNVSYYYEPQECLFMKLTAEINPCFNFDYTVGIDFDHVAVSDSFALYIDGALDGHYPYDALPLEIGPFVGDGTTEHVVEVRDLVDMFCEASVSFGPVSCNPDDCSISNLRMSTLECTNELFYPVVIDFDFNNVSSPVFSVNSSQGNLGLFVFGSQPVTVNMPATHEDSTEYIIVSDNNNPDCADTLYFSGMECILPPCILNTMDITVEACVEDSFSYRVAVRGQNSSALYALYINDSLYGMYPYDEVLSPIGLFASNDSIGYRFRAEDSEDIGCNITRSLDPVLCEDSTRCNIYNMAVVRSSCTLGAFDVLLDFDHENSSDSFVVLGNQRVYGFYGYDELPIILSGLEGDGSIDYHFTVRDLGRGCTNSYRLGPISCPECRLRFEDVVVGECNNDLTVNVLVDIDYENLSGDFVELLGPLGSLGLFLAEDAPFMLSYPISGGEEYLKLVDPQQDFCSDSMALVVPDCTDDACLLSEAFINRFICDDALLTIELRFSAENSSDSFVVFANNTNYGVYAYDDIPVQIGPLPGDGQSVIEMSLSDQENGKCSLSFSFGPVNCVSGTQSLEVKKMDISPNPATSELQILHVSDLEIISASLYSSKGQKIYQWEETRTALPSVPSGLYFVEIITNKGTAVRKLIIVQQ